MSYLGSGMQPISYCLACGFLYRIFRALRGRAGHGQAVQWADYWGLLSGLDSIVSQPVQPQAVVQRPADNTALQADTGAKAPLKVDGSICLNREFC